MYTPKPIIPRNAVQRDKRVPWPLPDPANAAVIAVARRGSGKSSQILGWIDDVYARICANVCILSHTVNLDPCIAELQRRKHKNILVTEEVNNEMIKNILELQKSQWLSSDRKDRLCLFIDDAGDSAMKAELSDQLSKLMTRGRHVGAMVFLAIQSIKGQLSSKMRNQATHWLIFKNNQDDLKTLSKSLQSAEMDDLEMLRYLRFATAKPYSFAYINQLGRTREEKYFFCDEAGFHVYNV